MSTFLTLAQDVRRECGISGSGPTSVLNQTGELDRVVKWVRDAYTALQLEQPAWRWLRGNFSVQTTASVDTYAYNATGVIDADTGIAIARFKRWWTDEFQLYLTSAGQSTQHYLPYDRWENFRYVWLQGQRNPSYPVSASVDPQNRLRLGPKPDGIYTFTGEYQKSPQVLANDGDVPEMPAHFHDLITALAMRRYAAFMSAAEVWAEADRREQILRPSLEQDQIAEPRFALPLA